MCILESGPNGQNGANGQNGQPGTPGSQGVPGPSTGLSLMVFSAIPASAANTQISDHGIFPFSTALLQNPAVAIFSSPGWTLSSGSYWITISLQIEVDTSNTLGSENGAFLSLADAQSTRALGQPINIPGILAFNGVKSFSPLYKYPFLVPQGTTLSLHYIFRDPYTNTSGVRLSSISTTLLGSWCIQKLS